MFAFFIRLLAFPVVLAAAAVLVVVISVRWVITGEVAK